MNVESEKFRKRIWLDDASEEYAVVEYLTITRDTSEDEDKGVIFDTYADLQIYDGEFRVRFTGIGNVRKEIVPKLNLIKGIIDELLEEIRKGEK